MLIEFSVKNFRSFKDKVTLSMEKSIGEENKNSIFKCNNIELLKTSAIYGANASGKSNLIRAFAVAIMMIRNSNIIPIGGKWNDVIPFKLDEKTSKEPTTFEFIFITKGVKYNYSFSADNSKIYDEKLLAYYSQKPSVIFLRTKTNKYETPVDDNKLKNIISQNTDNKLLLSTATTWNYEKTKDPYLWFVNSIDVYDNFNYVLDEDLKSFSEDNKELKEFTLKLLKEADIIINDIYVNFEEKEMDINMANLLFPPLARTKELPKVKNLNIELEHKVKDNDGKYHTYKFDFNDESSGTKVLFNMAPFLKRAFEKQCIIIVDELERSMHPMLVKYIINLFNNLNINKVNSQLIFTTHAVNLLDLDIFRRDEIWLTEKKSNTGASNLYSLDDFSVRTSENIEKGYLNGRYGAVPFIRDISILWEE